MKQICTLIFLFFVLGSYSSSSQTISGTLAICPGVTTTLTGSPAGGTWSTGFVPVGTVDPATGVVTGIAVGSTSITYTTGSGSATAVVTVNPSPAFTLSPSTIVCGSSTTLAGSPSGGLWSVTTPWSASGVATVGVGSGIITGTAAGTATVSYRVGICAVTNVLSVTPTTSGSISGPSTVCIGASIMLSPSTSGGTWSVTNGNATVTSTGSVNGVTPGLDTIVYSVATPCASFTTSYVVTVTASPGTAPISGDTVIACGGTGTLSNSISGGTWASSSPTIASVGATTGILTGYMPGTVMIYYGVSLSCGSTTISRVVTVTPTPPSASISGSSVICVGDTTTLFASPSGGTWTSGMTAATVSSAGLVTGFIAGMEAISYSVSTSCGTASATHIVTVTPTAIAGSITGIASISCGDITTLGSTVPGGSWVSSNPAVATITTATGIVNGIVPGTTTITYTVSSSCGTATTTDVLTVTAPSVLTSVTPVSCSDNYTAVSSGATTYAWLPTTSVSCPTCATTDINPAATTTYTVTGSSGAGCSASSTVTVNGDRIKGNVTFTTPPSGSATSKVWLIQFNPLDSSITGLDSQLTCFDGTNEYYQFDSKPTGSYLVKARLLSSVTGTSGYIPTYGASSAVWYAGTSINHTGATDVQNIAMIWGTVPSGSGFISGYVYAGAGKGTSGEAPVAGMLIYLKDATTGQVLTYTYTDAAGTYTFNSLAYGSYIVYPEEYDYSTTPSSVITLTAEHLSSTAVSFKQYTNKGTIKPWAIPNGVAMVDDHQQIAVYPNPATDMLTIKWLDIAGEIKLTITDIVGKEVDAVNMENFSTSGERRVKVGHLSQGMYMLRLQSNNVNYTQKIFVAE